MSKDKEEKKALKRIVKNGRKARRHLKAAHKLLASHMPLTGEALDKAIKDTKTTIIFAKAELAGNPPLLSDTPPDEQQPA